MRLILIIAAGILLAFILLPFLGTIVMALIAVVVFAALIYGLAVAIPWLIRSIFIFIAVGKVGADAAKGAAKDTAEKSKQKRSFRATVKTAPEFCRGLAAIKELLVLQNLRYRPVGLWYLYILNDRIRNCYMTGLFRVEDKLNRAHLEKCLNKVVSRSNDPDTTLQAQTLCQEILNCHDSLCKMYRPETGKTSRSSAVPEGEQSEAPKPRLKEYPGKNDPPKYAFNKQNRKLHASTCKKVNNTFGYVAESDLRAFLAETEEEISWCKICLKNDDKVQTLVEAHNRKIGKL